MVGVSHAERKHSVYTAIVRVQELIFKHRIYSSDGRFPYSKSKIEIFSQNRKNRNLDFITSLCIDFY